jgi:ABC-type lipoprotein release transport system permease subunit
MNVLVTISLRNLIRQKRRNLLLGIAIAFGTMVLVIANSFSHGISENLFNKIVVYISGHVSVAFSENGNQLRQIFHDGPRAMEIVKREIPDVLAIQEAISVFSRVIGNGKSDNAVMIAIDLNLFGKDKKTDQEIEQNFKMIEGKFEELRNDAIENPVILAKQKADYLKVKKGDIVKVRYRTVNGQDRAERLTVVGIFNPANIFMSAPIFLEVKNLKTLMDYGPNDIGNLFLTIKDPRKNAIAHAEKLHAAFKPSTIQISGTVQNGSISKTVTVLGFKTDTISRTQFGVSLGIHERIGKNGVIISDSLASSLNLKENDPFKISYISKYKKHSREILATITRIYTSKNEIPDNIVFVNELDLNKTVFSDWPDSIDNKNSLLKITDSLQSVLTSEWVLLPRAKTTDEFVSLQKDIGQKQYKGTTVDVRTMYESASAVMSLEKALNLITLVAVLVLFFIILIGVINTLRMTVRERTREIGTIRAIGMQKKDVQKTFVLETFFLTLFSSVTGSVLGLVFMKLTSFVKIKSDGNPIGMLLVNEHLYFVPSVINILLFILLILLIAIGTAFFPARKAANLAAADALRHIE